VRIIATLAATTVAALSLGQLAGAPSAHATRIRHEARSQHLRVRHHQRLRHRSLRLRAGGTGWTTWWGSANYLTDGVVLASTPPTSPSETHSALVTSGAKLTNPTITLSTNTLSQLRTGSAPNAWEVGWVFFRFRDLSHYYWFALKPNGFELGKKQGSLDQHFLVTGTSPKLSIGTASTIKIAVSGSLIRVWVDGAPVLSYTDPHPLSQAGSVGLYEEDSHVRFSSVAIH
jgi:hypothetical protein